MKASHLIAMCFLTLCAEARGDLIAFNLNDIKRIALSAITEKRPEVRPDDLKFVSINYAFNATLNQLKVSFDLLSSIGVKVEERGTQYWHTKKWEVLEVTLTNDGVIEEVVSSYKSDMHLSDSASTDESALDADLVPHTKEEATADVMIQFFVGEDGAPEGLEVISSTNPAMNKQAIEKAKLMKITDPKLKGQKVRVPIHFD